MEKLQFWGSALVFIGLMLVLAPHFIHHIHPDGEDSNNLEDPFEHIYLFTLPGILPTLLGVYLLKRQEEKVNACQK